MNVKPLRLLLVEDHEDDALLLVHELREQGYEPDFHRVDSAQAMREVLGRHQFDVVLADYSMPGFNAFGALEVLNESGLDLPFIIVSGVIGEERAVDAMKAGAHDYLIKDKLARLGAVIERELRDARQRAEQRGIREKLILSERMTSIGTLAAGVAHEINNPLAALLLNVEWAEGQLEKLAGTPRPADPDRWWSHVQGNISEIRERLADISEATTRVQTIVQGLRGFTREDENVAGSVDLHGLIDESLSLLRNELRHRAQVIRKFAMLPRFSGNEARLRQVLVNLLINAAQSIPDGKIAEHSITVTTRLVADGSTGSAAGMRAGSHSSPGDPGDDRGADNGRENHPDRVTGQHGTERWIEIELRDTGSGIASEDLGRVFEPFFTTKPVGVGTGLGLWTSHRIVAAMGGDLRISSSRPGEGTTVVIRLPAPVDADTSVPAPISPADAEPAVLTGLDESGRSIPHRPAPGLSRRTADPAGGPAHGRTTSHSAARPDDRSSDRANAPPGQKSTSDPLPERPAQPAPGASPHSAPDRLMPESSRPAPGLLAQGTPDSHLASERPIRILVIDDDELVNQSIRRVLGYYDVVVTQSAREALDIIDRSEDRSVDHSPEGGRGLGRPQSGDPGSKQLAFDVVLSDVMMPDMTGAELYEALIERNPAWADRIVFMTGGPFTATAEQFLRRRTHPVLTKPFTARALRLIIREALDSLEKGR